MIYTQNTATTEVSAKAGEVQSLRSSQACHHRNLGPCRVDAWVAATEVSQSISSLDMTSTAIQRVPPRGLTSVAYPTLFRSPFYTFANPDIHLFTPPAPGLASGPVRLVAHRAMLVRVYVDSRAPGIRAARAALPVHAQISLITPTATIPIGTARPSRARDLGVTPHQSVAVERLDLARTLNVIVPAARITPAVTGVRVTLVPQRGWRECRSCAGLRNTYALTGLHIETVTPSIDARGQPSEALPLDVFFLSWPATPAPTGSQRKAALAKVRDYVQGAYPVAEGAVQVYDHSAPSATGLGVPTPPQDAQGRFDCFPILGSFEARIQATLDGTVPDWSTRDPASGAVGTTPSSPTQRGQAPPLVMPRYMGIISEQPAFTCGGSAPEPGRALIAQPVGTPHELGHNITFSHAGDFHGEDGPGVGQPPGTQPFQPFPDVPRYPQPRSCSKRVIGRLAVRV